MNSNVAQSFLNIISPTLDYNAGYVSKIPYIDNPHDDITSSVNGSISISKSDWDSHETSWDFEANPLVASATNTRKTAVAQHPIALKIS